MSAPGDRAVFHQHVASIAMFKMRLPQPDRFRPRLSARMGEPAARPVNGAK
jgi:hypothetical protein